MLAEMCFLIFFDLPLGNSAFFAAFKIPLVSQPACSSTSFGMPHRESFIAVGCNLSPFSLNGDIFDAVQETASRRPQFDLPDEQEEVNLLAVVFLFYLFYSHFLRAFQKQLNLGHTRPLSGEPGSHTRLHRFRVYAILPICPPRLFPELGSTTMHNMLAVPNCSGSWMRRSSA